MALIVNRVGRFCFCKGAGVSGQAGTEADSALCVVLTVSWGPLAYLMFRYGDVCPAVQHGDNDGTNGQIGPACLPSVDSERTGDRSATAVLVGIRLDVTYRYALMEFV